jgi:hypothetical protein
MQMWIKLGVLACALLVFVSVSGCLGGGTGNSVPITTATATPTATATATPTATPTAKATVKPTATPTAKPTTDYSKSIEQHWVNEGNYVVVPFVKSTYEGKEAYKGSVSDGQYTYKLTEVLTSTSSEASSYGATLLSKYMAQGYMTESSEGDNTVLSKGNSMIGIGIYGVVYGTNSPGVAILEY